MRKFKNKERERKKDFANLQIFIHKIYLFKKHKFIFIKLVNYKMKLIYFLKMF